MTTRVTVNGNEWTQLSDATGTTGIFFAAQSQVDIEFLLASSTPDNDTDGGYVVKFGDVVSLNNGTGTDKLYVKALTANPAYIIVDGAI